MARFLEERMTRTYSDLSERQELEPDTALVKTYLVEAHPPDDHAQNIAEGVLGQVLGDESLRRRFPCELHSSDEPSLATVEGIFDEQEAISLYVDSTDRRYWLIHTMGSSQAADWIIGRLMKAGARIDQAWLPAQMLEQLSFMGSFRGLGLDFDRRPFEPDEEEEEIEALQFLKMQLWGNRARRVLQVLRDERAFPDATTLAKVKVKFWPDDQDPESFSLDDIKFDGKMTARGSSFDAHVFLAGTLKNSYAREITRLEETYSIAFESESQELSGKALDLDLGRRIDDLDRFCSTVFSSSEPFRLWGTPVRTSRTYYRVRAVDLHVGGRIDFEITPTFVRIYLPRGTCANTVMRFYTNLQHHFDSRVRLQGGDGEDVLEF